MTSRQKDHDRDHLEDPHLAHALGNQTWVAGRTQQTNEQKTETDLSGAIQGQWLEGLRPVWYWSEVRRDLPKARSLRSPWFP
jgi:hypothetical protein